MHEGQTGGRKLQTEDGVLKGVLMYGHWRYEGSRNAALDREKIRFVLFSNAAVEAAAELRTCN